MKWLGISANLVGDRGPVTKLDRHVGLIAAQGQLVWRQATASEKRLLIATIMGRHKAETEPRPWPRGFAAQKAEAAIGV